MVLILSLSKDEDHAPSPKLDRPYDAVPAPRAEAFTRVLGRPVAAKPVFSRLTLAFTPLLALVAPQLRDGIKVLAWIRKGGYVSRDTDKQKGLFGPPPTIDDVVARYCRDKGLS